MILNDVFSAKLPSLTRFSDVLIKIEMFILNQRKVPLKNK